MATTTGYLDFTEQAEPSAPAAGHQRVYIDSTTHKLKATNSSGTDRDIEGTGGSSAFNGAKAYHNTTQTVGAAITALNLNSEDFDTASYHDTVTNNTRMTVPTTGYYRVTGHAQFAMNATCILGLRIDGTTTVRGSAVAGDGASEKYQTTAIVFMTSGHYIELWAYQSSSGAVGDTTNAENMTSLEIEFLGT